MKRITFLLAFLLSCTSMAQDQKVSLEKAVTETKQENWQKADALYTELLRNRPKDPHLLSNYAQVKLALEKPWHAFALWQKALHYHSDFQAAKQGINFLIEKNLIPEGDYEPNFMAQARLLFLQAPSIFPLGLLFIFFFLGFSLWVRYLIQKKEARDLNTEIPDSPIRAYVYLSLFFLFTLLALYHYSENQKDYGALLAESRLFLAPNEESVGLDTLRPGEKLEIKRSKGNWLQIDAGEGQLGWLKKDRVLLF